MCYRLFLEAKQESISLYNRYLVLSNVFAKHSLFNNVEIKKEALSIIFLNSV